MTFSDWQAILSFNGGSGYSWQRHGSNTYFRVYHAGGGYNMYGLTTGDLGNAGMLACSWNGSTLTAYIDGEEAASTPCMATPGTSDTAKLKFGSTGCYVAHLILVYDRALRGDEIRRLHEEPCSLLGSGQALAPITLGAGQVHTLVGSLTGTLSLSAPLRTARRILGAIDGGSYLSACLNALRSLEAACTATSDLAGVLAAAGVVTLDGTTGGVASLTGRVTVVSLESPPEPSLEVLTPWREAALFNGATHVAYQLGTALTLGWFWTRRSGCSAVYRGPSIADVNFTDILAVGDTGASQIMLPAYVAHEPGSTYCYVVRRFNSCGHQEQTRSAAVKAVFAPDGAPADPLPNGVVGLHARLSDGSSVRLRWFYCPLEQKAVPSQFNVYWDSGTGPLDLESPLAEVPYEGRRFYDYQSASLPEGLYTFVVRAQSAGAAEREPGAHVTCPVRHTTAQSPRLL
jgi:hypothetical protein